MWANLEVELHHIYLSSIYLFPFHNSNIFTFIYDRDKRKIIEAGAITNFDSILQRQDFYKILPSCKPLKICSQTVKQFLSLRVFKLLFSSLWSFSQRFGRYALRPTSDVCRTREPTRNSSYVLYSCNVIRLQSGLNPQPPP